MDIPPRYVREIAPQKNHRMGGPQCRSFMIARRTFGSQHLFHTLVRKPLRLAGHEGGVSYPIFSPVAISHAQPCTPPIHSGFSGL